MRDLIDLIGLWSPEKWEALGTMLTAFVAVAAAIFAGQQVRQARKLREEQAQPFVVVSFEPSAVWGNAINLVVQNIGNTVARDVRFKFDQPLKSKARSKDINETKLFKEGVAIMPPGMRLDTLFDLSHERYESGLPMSYRVEVCYHGIGKKKPERMEYVLDLEIFYGLERFTEHGMHQLAKSVMEMNKTMKKWTGRRGRLNVWTADEDYDKWADRWQQERGGDFPSLGLPLPAGRQSPSKYDHLRERSVTRLRWRILLPVKRKLEQHRGKREDRRLEAAGRSDLVIQRKMMRGEL